MSSAQEAGTPAYLISSKWLKRYYGFILFDQFNSGASDDKITFSEDHFTRYHPGPISNQEDLIEEDQDKLNLYGTGRVAGQEKEYID